jgi:predicted alpha-1,2-mannosidase
MKIFSTLSRALLNHVLIVLLIAHIPFVSVSGQSTLWKIGENDNNASDMALAPEQYTDFLQRDFGWEDRFFLVGFSETKNDWPYILPGPRDDWGGTGPTSGIRSHFLNVLFGLANTNLTDNYELVIDLLDSDHLFPPTLKVTVNGRSWKFNVPPGVTHYPGLDSISFAKEHLIKITIPNGLVVEGANQVQLTSLSGGWLMFDQIRFEGPPKAVLKKYDRAFLRNVSPAAYEIEDKGSRYQPLLVDIEHLLGEPIVTVKLDKKFVFAQKLESGRYQLEVPMPAVSSQKNSAFEVLIDNSIVKSGNVNRSSQPLATPADYVDTQIGTAHSRWMIAPGPWMPFSMVKISPDNQPPGWQSGYDPTIESIGAFSHIHEWTMAGIGMLPVTGPLKTKVGDDAHPGQGYRSTIDKSSEEAPLGYYKIHLQDYDIKAEITATTRCSFQRYTFPGEEGRVMIDLQTPAEYDYGLKQVEIKKLSDKRIEGYSMQLTPEAWGRDAAQEYTIHFVIEFDQPVKRVGVWSNDSIISQSVLIGKDVSDAGMFVEFDTKNNNVVQVRTGISFVSLENARMNLDEEIVKSFGWSFDQVRAHQLNTWNELLGRIKIYTSDRREKIRFYTNMYRALCSRNIFSDVNGQWKDATEQTRQLSPGQVALGCDAFWNTFWNLNQFWNLVTPDWSSKWVNSQLAMYDANGWLAKGPAGMEYIPVMVAEHEIPLIVSAYQMGIRDFDKGKALEAAIKMQTHLPERVGGGFAGNADLEAYLRYKYVPYDKGRFSNSLEYSFDDYAVAQFAKTLAHDTVYRSFMQRAGYWQNVIDKTTGYARLRNSLGEWLPDFDPFKSGANEHYVEGNAWQLTFFVPQDISGLADMIGKKQFIDRLSWGFIESNKLRYNAPNDQYWDYPVIQGNQQSMHFAFLFNWVNRPWLTQLWSRSIVDRYYGFGVANAYLGDEDQGQMSAWFIMASLGLFQTDGGTSSNPVYEIGSPLFEKVQIDLAGRYGRGKVFTIEAKNTSRKNKFIQNASLNGKPLLQCWFYSRELLKGGSLVFEMGDHPNEKWGIEAPPVSR